MIHYCTDIRSAFQRELTILTTTIIIHVVHNYKCCNTIPESISLSAHEQSIVGSNFHDSIVC